MLRMQLSESIRIAAASAPSLCAKRCWLLLADVAAGFRSSPKGLATSAGRTRIRLLLAGLAHSKPESRWVVASLGLTILSARDALFVSHLIFHRKLVVVRDPLVALCVNLKDPQPPPFIDLFGVKSLCSLAHYSPEK